MLKYLFTTLLFFIFYSVSQGQLFGEKVYIYGIKFKAREVTGIKRFEGNPDYYRTKILDPLIIQRNDKFYYALGSYRRNKDVMETLGLFNLSNQINSYPFLDSIDYDFYRNIGFSRVETNTPDIVNDPNYKKVKSYYFDSLHLSISERKKILFEQPDSIKNLIILSRYAIISNPFSIDKKKVTKTTAELKAQLDTITISANAEVSAKVRAYISRLADETTNLLGYFIDARLEPDYISKINYYTKTTPKIRIGNDEFAFNLKNYVESENAAANTGLVAIRLEGSFDKTRISVDSISAELSGRFQIPSVDAKRIAASINYTFIRQETVTFKGKFNNTFIIRYTTSSIVDDIALLENKFTYEDGRDDGLNMGILNKQLETFYATNGNFPTSLKDLGINEVINKLGDTNLDYKVLSPTTIRLVFAGPDFTLNTSDDKIYSGKDGKITRNN